MESAKYDVIVHCPQIGACGLNCKHCWIPHNLKQHKPLEEVKQMIDGLAELHNEPAIASKVLIYFLDELTLHPQVIDILSYCREQNVLPQQTLVSNGHGIAARDNWEEILSELKKCGLKGFLMTVNGDEEYHDWFTGSKGSFQKTLEATRRANAYGFRVAWNMYLTNENVDQLAEAARMKGDDRIHIGIPVHTTKWRQWSHVHADISVLAKIPEDCQKYVSQEFKSEAEWSNLILNGEIASPKQESSRNKGEIRVAGYFECNGKVYDGIALPEYEMGSVNYEKLRELYSSEDLPPGIVSEKTMNLQEIARIYGDPNSTIAFTFEGLMRRFTHNHSMNQSPASE